MTIIITGGTSGIGLACAKRLCATDSLVIVGSKAQSVANAVKQIPSEHHQHEFICGDVRNAKTAEEAVQLALKIGPIKALVYSAGVGRSAKTEEMDFEDTWDRVFDVNVNGAFHFVKACLPHMINQKSGHIALISSTAGIEGVKRDAAYSASKHALVGLAKSVAREHGKRGVVAVPICPGFVQTPMTDRTIAGLARHKGISEAAAHKLIESLNPQERIMRASEVAEAVAFVLSGKCNAISGHELVLSCGGL